MNTKKIKFNGSEISDRAKIAVIDLILEYGIPIEIEEEYEVEEIAGYKLRFLSHLRFKIMDHVFENLRDVKKALQNKAFF